MELTRATAPWAYAKGEPFRAIAALELLGTLVSLMVLVPVAERRGEASALITLSASTDNQGNTFLLDKLLTTKYPLGVVLMELAHQLTRRRMSLRARWLPRLQNQEADDLTNGEFRHFDSKRRIPVDLDRLGFEVMPVLFPAGDEYLSELERHRAEAARKKAAESARKPGVKSRRSS